jgi:pyrroloquinoline quinone biosynthesis protein B
VVLTSAEIDHVAGLLHMREGHAFDLVALPSVLDALEDNSIFGAVGYQAKRAEDGEIIQMNSGLRLKLFSVPGKAALYREGDDPRLGSVGGETAGLLVEASGGTLAYIPGCAAISPEVENRARAADVVLFDGTLFADREMIEQGIGQKTGSRMGHLPITGEGGSVDFLASLPARRKIYTHLNNTNPALIDGSPERVALEKRGIEVAYDGMEIEL